MKLSTVTVYCQNMENVGFIGVHVGAGQYSSKSIPLYEKLCRIACKKSIEILNSGGSSLEAVTVATAILEDSELTNAGKGSNLTIDGYVECDASVMNGSDLNFGAVGAVSGVKNPVLLAKKICCNQSKPMELGRIPPSVVVGPGAYEIAQKSSDVLTVFPESLITPNAQRLCQKYKRYLHSTQSQEPDLECTRLDTVGAVAVDKNGKTAAACSSGGILLKQPGRIGQAAMYGCGCWAETSSQFKNNVAVTTTGCGEHLMKTILAREVGMKMKESTNLSCVTLNESINSAFLNSPFLHNVDEKLCGLLVLTCSPDNREFLWAHTTASFCIGYMDTVTNEAKSRVSQLPNLTQVGKMAIVEGTSF